MDRRAFLKLSALVAAAQALEALPVAAEQVPATVVADRTHYLKEAAAPYATRLAIHEPGTYQISGRVRLQAPVVEISGIADKQSISWSDSESSEAQLTSFTTFAHFDRPGLSPNVQIVGGQLEALDAVLIG